MVTLIWLPCHTICIYAATTTEAEYHGSLCAENDVYAIISYAVAVILQDFHRFSMPYSSCGTSRCPVIPAR